MSSVSPSTIKNSSLRDRAGSSIISSRPWVSTSRVSGNERPVLHHEQVIEGERETTAVPTFLFISLIPAGYYGMNESRAEKRHVTEKVVHAKVKPQRTSGTSGSRGDSDRSRAKKTGRNGIGSSKSREKEGEKEPRQEG